MKKEIMTNMIFPGDYVSEIEEFEGGRNTFVVNGSVRSHVLGNKELDLKRRVVKISQKNSPDLPKVGDIIVGYIEMLFGPMISVRILFINDKKSLSGFSAIATTRLTRNWSGERDRRVKNIYRVGDMVRGRVISLLNSSIHITIEDKEYGILYSLCYNCGGDTVKINNGIKCIECGIYEDKKLTNDYGKDTVKSIFIQKLR